MKTLLIHHITNGWYEVVVCNTKTKKSLKALISNERLIRKACSTNPFVFFFAQRRLIKRVEILNSGYSQRVTGEIISDKGVGTYVKNKEEKEEWKEGVR